MSNCHYTRGTEFEFNTECCDNGGNINVVGVFPQNRIENALVCNGTTTDQWVQFNIPEIIDIPSQKPDMEGIVGVNSCIEIISQRVINTPQVTGYIRADGVFVPGNEIPNAECTNLTGKKLIIEGLLKQKVIYTALLPEQPLHSASFAIPFSVFIIIPGDTTLTQSFRINAYIEDVYACMLSERSVFKNTTIFIKASEVC